MGAKLGSSDGPMAELNVTPLIDVVLVLLVVFMVITPMLEAGIPVTLPSVPPAGSASCERPSSLEPGAPWEKPPVCTVDEQKYITISVAPGEVEGDPVRWSVMGELPATPEELVEAINAELTKDGEAYAAHFEANRPKETAPQPRKLLLKADAGLPYGDVRKVMDIISEGGWGTLQLAVDDK